VAKRYLTPDVAHQLVDWFYTLDDFKKTERFAKKFGHGHITFLALLCIGRNAGVSESNRNRLKWRNEKVRRLSGDPPPSTW
jgi:lipoate synthase